jgi:hypothetical protein
MVRPVLACSRCGLRHWDRGGDLGVGLKQELTLGVRDSGGGLGVALAVWVWQK